MPDATVRRSEAMTEGAGDWADADEDTRDGWVRDDFTEWLVNDVGFGTSHGFRED